MATWYDADIYGSNVGNPYRIKFQTIKEAREYAESYGTQIDGAVIRNHNGKIVARHVRDTRGDGTRWFKASV